VRFQKGEERVREPGTEKNDYEKSEKNRGLPSAKTGDPQSTPGETETPAQTDSAGSRTLFLVVRNGG